MRPLDHSNPKLDQFLTQRSRIAKSNSVHTNPAGRFHVML
jgi:hypothetical protein